MILTKCAPQIKTLREQILAQGYKLILVRDYDKKQVGIFQKQNESFIALEITGLREEKRIFLKDYEKVTAFISEQDNLYKMENRDFKSWIGETYKESTFPLLKPIYRL